MPYCKMFESGLVVNPGGTVRPCCHFINSEDTFKYYEDGWYEHHQQLGEIMASGEDFIPECRECKHMADLGIDPMLNVYNEKYQNDDGLVHVELKINNTCNLSCVMCDSWSSSTWDKIVKANPQLPDSMKKIYGTSPKQKWHKDIEALTKYLDKCKVLKFTGGEPFLIPQTFKIIDYCIQSGLSKNITLEFITNGTQDLVQYIDKFKKFKQTSIQYSIDAVGKRFEYIRQGAKWNDVESKVLDFQKQIKHTNIHLGLVVAVQVLNYRNLPELKSWADKHNLEMNTKNYVTDPEYMHPHALQDEKLTEKLIYTLQHLDKIHGTNYKEFLDA